MALPQEPPSSLAIERSLTQLMLEFVKPAFAFAFHRGKIKPHGLNDRKASGDVGIGVF